MSFIDGLGAVLFGFTIGWIAYRILRLRIGAFGISDIIALLAVIGGAAVLALFRNDVSFGWYAIGLVIGFFAYFALGLRLSGRQEAQPWLSPTSTPDPQSGADPDK